MRTLFYTCADKLYSHWIPLYCLSLLMHNDNIDIEIGMEGELDKEERFCVDYLRSEYPASKIIIHENLFTVRGGVSFFNGKRMLINTVRFLSVPSIKDDYVYIGDIDILCMEKNISDQHISHMKTNGCKYSNILRPTDKSRMTGLHFSEYDSYYPLPYIDDMNLLMNDEQLLKIMVERRGLLIDNDTTFRPVHGIHFSKNRPTVCGSDKIPGWGAEIYRTEWNVFTNTIQYKVIYEHIDEQIKTMIRKLEEYYYTTK